MLLQVTREIRPEGGVVVGDDGSDVAGRAVRFALDEARRRDAPLHVLRAWTMMTAELPPDVPAGIVPSLSELESSTLAAEQARIAELIGDEAVEVHVCHGPPAQVLLAASESADVLIVGNRGRGGVASLLLGSVAEECVRRADCPVVVARGRL
ncbi:universal stress protein [Nocardioides donggukensis]|uniref:Universal stress protein n=1 Tax=Nocardioides donggukensis TaxID=2774019 RepID=A0A927K3P0_9ACTN|nr:universal stress protein [Nocardioides donggukensis]MBD8870042.1 universal stress protein [Nocardioides donggukensis]